MRSKERTSSESLWKLHVITATSGYFWFRGRALSSNLYQTTIFVCACLQSCFSAFFSRSSSKTRKEKLIFNKSAEKRRKRTKISTRYQLNEAAFVVCDNKVFRECGAGWGWLREGLRSRMTFEAFESHEIALSRHPCMNYQVRFTFPSPLALSPSSSPFSLRCEYIFTFHLIIDWGRSRFVYYLCRYRKNSPENENIFTFTPKFSKIYFRRQLASSEQLRVLTRHFRMQQLTCGAHWWAAGATGPREALSEQYFAPCLLLCQPPEKTRDENAISCRLITASR